MEFIELLNKLIEEAKANTEQNRGSEIGRQWAIIRTDLEKTLAYVEKTLKEN